MASVHVLTLNAGSSSIKFAIYDLAFLVTPLLSGQIERMGFSDTSFTAQRPSGKALSMEAISGDGPALIQALLGWLEAQPEFADVSAVGHRIVFGQQHTESVVVTEELLAELQGYALNDPEHLPKALDLISALGQRHPDIRQVACFDTAFHSSMPRVARMLPIPRRFEQKAVQRYGYHGISFAYLMEELAKLGDPAAKNGRVILAHLGSGASLAAVRNGKSIDTSMSFTPAAGLMMGTRSGDLDPGLITHLLRTEHLSANQWNALVTRESGLLGVSETSSDMRDLISRATTDERAAEAIALFCYQAKKWIGGYAAALGGVDTLVFAGGIGEHCPSIRANICEGLEFLGIRLDPSLNAASEKIISDGEMQSMVRVMHTDEELMMAREVSELCGMNPIAK